MSACAQLSSDSGMPIIKKSIKGGIYENDTELSKYVCGLKHSSIDFEISWEVIKRAQPIADGNSPICRLCLKEATAVLYALKNKTCLNKKASLYCLVDICENLF